MSTIKILAAAVLLCHTLSTHIIAQENKPESIRIIHSGVLRAADRKSGGISLMDFSRLGNVEDADVARLKVYSNVEILELRCTGVGDAGLLHLRGLNRLRVLDLTFTQVTDAGLRELRMLPALRELKLYGNKSITGSGVSELTGLEVLELQLTSADDARMVAVGKLTNLKALDLGGARVGDSGLQALSKLQTLERLNLSRLIGGDGQDNAPTDAGVKHLLRLKKLQYLSLAGTKITDAGIRDLANLPQLQGLNLRNTDISDASLTTLKSLTQLRQLQLGATRLTDSGLAELSGLKTLEHLVIDGTHVTDAGLKVLRTMTTLKFINVSNTKVTQNGSAKLRRFLPKAEIEASAEHHSTVKGPIVLVEHCTKSFRNVDAVALPNRVYLKASLRYGKSLHFLSNRFGELGLPEGILMVGTVVRGDRLGGSRLRYYQLTSVPSWKRVTEPGECREVYLTQDDDDEGLSWEATPAAASPQRVKYEQAQDRFRDQVKDVRDKVMAALDKAEQAATGTGNDVSLTELKRRREQFLLRSEIPDLPDQAQLRQQLRAARSELDAALSEFRKQEPDTTFYERALDAESEYSRLLSGATAR